MEGMKNVTRNEKIEGKIIKKYTFSGMSETIKILEVIKQVRPGMFHCKISNGYGIFNLEGMKERIV